VLRLLWAHKLYNEQIVTALCTSSSFIWTKWHTDCRQELTEGSLYERSDTDCRQEVTEGSLYERSDTDCSQEVTEGNVTYSHGLLGGGCLGRCPWNRGPYSRGFTLHLFFDGPNSFLYLRPRFKRMSSCPPHCLRSCELWSQRFIRIVYTRQNPDVKVNECASFRCSPSLDFHKEYFRETSTQQCVTSKTVFYVESFLS
jgi:hypothetical protein